MTDDPGARECAKLAVALLAGPKPGPRASAMRLTGALWRSERLSVQPHFSR